VVQALTGMMMANGDHPDAPPSKVGFPVIDVAAGLLAALAIVSSLRLRDIEGKGQTVDASMVQAALTLMYPFTSTCLTTGKSPERLGNRGYSGSPTADTYECADGWLATAANTPPQFRNFTRVLGLEALCEDARGIDVAAFNAPNGGFVVAKDFEYLRSKFREAFRKRSAKDMERELNAAGVPAARVRTLGEFLADAPGRVTLPVFDLGGVKTSGLGFAMRGQDGPVPGAAPALGADNAELLGRA
jgi:crotonobetainyl-CoA:carnitine CoA-transferase CaiB-like acyl-CoA transferase